MLPRSLLLLFLLDGRLSVPNTCCFYLHRLRKGNNSVSISSITSASPLIPACCEHLHRVLVQFAVQWWTRSEKWSKLNVTFLLSPDNFNRDYFTTQFNILAYKNWSWHSWRGRARIGMNELPSQTDGHCRSDGISIDFTSPCRLLPYFYPLEITVTNPVHL